MPVDTWRTAGPALERPIKSGWVLETRPRTNFCGRQTGLGQQLDGDVTPQFVLDDLETGALFVEAPGQGAGGHQQGMCNFVELDLTGKPTLEVLTNAVADQAFCKRGEHPVGGCAQQKGSNRPSMLSHGRLKPMTIKVNGRLGLVEAGWSRIKVNVIGGVRRWRKRHVNTCQWNLLPGQPRGDAVYQLQHHLLCEPLRAHGIGLRLQNDADPVWLSNHFEPQIVQHESKKLSKAMQCDDQGRSLDRAQRKELQRARVQWSRKHTRALVFDPCHHKSVKRAELVRCCPRLLGVEQIGGYAGMRQASPTSVFAQVGKIEQLANEIDRYGGEWMGHPDRMRKARAMARQIGGFCK